MNYIITSADSGFLLFLFEFLSSLRNLGNYKEKIIVFFYTKGENETLIANEIAKYFDAKIIIKNVESHISPNEVYFDSIPIIRQLQPEDKIAIIDCDGWFQSDVNNLFKKDFSKIICSPEAMKNSYNEKYMQFSIDTYTNKYPGIITEKFKKNIQLLKEHSPGNFINTGLITSAQKILLPFLKIHTKNYISEEMKQIMGPDQVITNLLYNPSIFNIHDNYLYNACFNDLNRENLIIKDGVVYYCGQKAVFVHTQQKKFYKKYLLHFLHNSLYNKDFIQMSKETQEFINKLISTLAYKQENYESKEREWRLKNPQYPYMYVNTFFLD